MKQDHFDAVEDKLSTDWQAFLECQIDLFLDAELEFLNGMGLFNSKTPLLDVGCGTGAWSRAVLSRFKSLKVVATDANDSLLEKFIHSLTSDVRSGVSVANWKVGSSLAPPQVRTCEVAVCRYVLQHQKDPALFLSELAAALPKGARIIMIEDDDPLFAMNPNMPEFTDMFRIQKKWSDKFNSTDTMGRQCKAAAQKAGLDVRSVRILGQSSLQSGLAEFCKFYSLSLDLIASSGHDVLNQKDKIELQERLRAVPQKYPSGIVVHPQVITVAQVV